MGYFLQAYVMEGIGLVCKGGNDAPSKMSLWNAIELLVLKKGLQESRPNLARDAPNDENDM